MIVCDKCHSLEAKTLAVSGTVQCKPPFAGADGEFKVDLCRNCYDELRQTLGLMPKPPLRRDA